MSLLQFIVIITSIVFILFGIDFLKHKKMNILHFLVFFVGGGLVLLVTINTELLTKLWDFFWTTRGTDVFIFVWIVSLFYLYFDFYNKFTKQKIAFSELLSENTVEKTIKIEEEKIKNRKNTNPKDNYIFHIRVFNEDSMVWNIIDEIIAEWFNKIVLIDDGSSDNSLNILKQKQKQYKDKLIIILHHQINRGGGAANKTWYKFLKKYGDLLKIQRWVTFDADWQMDIKDIYNFMKTIDSYKNKENKENKEIDLLIWSRFIKNGKSINMPKLRKYILKIAQIVTFFFYGAKITDPHMWFRVIQIENFKKFKITSDGMHYANEINEQIKKQKMKFIEVPVSISYTDYSLQKWQKNSNWIKLWFEMIYRKLFFR